jgi:hypothetical protein
VRLLHLLLKPLLQLPPVCLPLLQLCLVVAMVYAACSSAANPCSHGCSPDRVRLPCDGSRDKPEMLVLPVVDTWEAAAKA